MYHNFSLTCILRTTNNSKRISDFKITYIFSEILLLTLLASSSWKKTTGLKKHLNKMIMKAADFFLSSIAKPLSNYMQLQWGLSHDLSDDPLIWCGYKPKAIHWENKLTEDLTKAYAFLISLVLCFSLFLYVLPYVQSNHRAETVFPNILIVSCTFTLLGRWLMCKEYESCCEKTEG